MRILFVCTGNTCRSPIAAALLREKTSKVEVKSAGVQAVNGEPISLNALTVLKERGISYSDTSLKVNLELLEWADLVLTMTESQKYLTISLFLDMGHKIFTLKEYVGDGKAANIADPFGKDLSNYRQCAEEIDQTIKLLQKKIAHVAN